MSLSIFWETIQQKTITIQQKTITIRQLILYNPTKLWGVMHFLDSGLKFFIENLRAVKNVHAQ
jgi:hypothetical protein